MAMLMCSWIYLRKHLLALYQLPRVQVHSCKCLSKPFCFVVEEFEVTHSFYNLGCHFHRELHKSSLAV